VTPIVALLKTGAPRYVREYRRLVRFLKQQGASMSEIAELAVGGDYEAIGAAQAKLILDIAPKGPFRLIDVGCGSGRAAYALRDVRRLSYLGTDVVPSLLDYAARVVSRPDWRFELVNALVIPADEKSADIVAFMSVFTHLLPDEVGAYIREAERVLKPGGAILCSYLDRTNPQHVASRRPAWRQHIARLLGRDVMVSFTTEQTLSDQLSEAGFAVERSIKETQIGQHVLFGRKKD
jgi:ubiquinone/menaquinone biosynthesis C-methylase UbiE